MIQSLPDVVRGQNLAEVVDVNTVKILLNKGQSTLVDAEVYPLLRDSRWCAYVRHSGKKLKYYVYSSPTGVSMSRLIMNAPKGQEVDHVSGDTLDNRKTNLRICTHMENTQNQLKQSNCKGSIYKGVQKTRSGTWRAYMFESGAHGRQIPLGTYRTEEDAAKRYNYEALRRFGDFAKLNEILGLTREEAVLLPTDTITNVAVAGYTGVRTNKWGHITALVYYKNKAINLGRFDTIEDAAKARDKVELELKGAKAKLNFPI